ncbi:MAG: hypothetical protein A2Y79_07555 [Deltaproteobacteria bacterium RBG_13_43_22]|nr:MAG: hypothetical protein A2Y79_07555 [Deltaproteobacteria bacterium RBG_13_43_22]
MAILSTFYELRAGSFSQRMLDKSKKRSSILDKGNQASSTGSLSQYSGSSEQRRLIRRILENVRDKFSDDLR